MNDEIISIDGEDVRHLGPIDIGTILCRNASEAERTISIVRTDSIIMQSEENASEDGGEGEDTPYTSGLNPASSLRDRVRLNDKIIAIDGDTRKLSCRTASEAERMLSIAKEYDNMDSAYLNSLGAINQIQKPVEADNEGYISSSSSSSSFTSSSDSDSASIIIESDDNASQSTPLSRESLMTQIQKLVVEEDEGVTSGSTNHSGGSTTYSC